MRIWKKRDHIFTRCVYSEIVDSFYLGQCCLLTDLYWFPAWNQFNTHKIITWHLLDFTWQGSIDVGKILTGKNSDICSAHSWQEFSPPANFTRNRWVLVYSRRKKNLIGLQKMHPMLVNYSILQFKITFRTCKMTSTVCWQVKLCIFKDGNRLPDFQWKRET